MTKQNLTESIFLQIIKNNLIFFKKTKNQIFKKIYLKKMISRLP